MDLNGVVIIAFLVLMPWSLDMVTTLSSHDAARLAQLLLLLANAITVSVVNIRMTAPRSCSFTSAPVGVGVAVLAILCVVLAPLPYAALREFALFIGLGCISYNVATLPAASVRTVVSACAISMAIYAAIVLVCWPLPLMHGHAVDQYELLRGYSNYRFFSHVATIAIPIAAAATFPPFAVKVRSVARFAVVSVFAITLVGMSRASLLGIAMSVFAVCACVGSPASAFLKRLLALGGVGLAIYVLMVMLVPWILSVQQPSGNPADLKSWEARLYLWGIAVAYVKQAPWFGIGPMHFSHYPNAEAAHPHNFYLQVAAEWGVPMLILLLLACVRGLFRLVKAVRLTAHQPEGMLGIGLFVALCAAGVDACFSGNLVMPMSQVWLAVAIGLTIAWYRSKTPSVAARRPRPFVVARYAVVSLLILSQSWLVFTALVEAKNLATHLASTSDSVVKNAVSNPRFWSRGWF